jgi:hypothetical protein
MWRAFGRNKAGANGISIDFERGAGRRLDFLQKSFVSSCLEDGDMRGALLVFITALARS